MLGNILGGYCYWCLMCSNTVCHFVANTAAVRVDRWEQDHTYCPSRVSMRVLPCDVWQGWFCSCLSAFRFFSLPSVIRTLVSLSAIPDV